MDSRPAQSPALIERNHMTNPLLSRRTSSGAWPPPPTRSKATTSTATAWFLEQLPGTIFAEPSGDAVDHYHRYREDIALIAGLGFTSYRFSLEWARIEPDEGHFSVAALDHYRRVLEACDEHGLTPVVTFHHFTSPLWLLAAGGWEGARTAELFARYCDRAMAHLGDLIGVACTLNEPNLPWLLKSIGIGGEAPARPRLRTHLGCRRAAPGRGRQHRCPVPVLLHRGRVRREAGRAPGRHRRDQGQAAGAAGGLDACQLRYPVHRRRPGHC